MKLFLRNTACHLKVKHNRFFLLLLFILMTYNAFGQDGYEIKKIKFEGNKTFKTSDLLPQLSIYETNFFQRIVQKKEPSYYNSQFIANDLERIIRFYQSNGFLYVQAKVDTFNINSKKNQLTSLDDLKYIVDDHIIQVLKTFMKTVTSDEIQEPVNEKVLGYLAIHLSEAIKRIKFNQQIPHLYSI